jgi:lysine 2,3-aminomutase
MELWQKNLAVAITDPDELAEYFSCDPLPLRQVAKRYPFQISTYYLGLIRGVNDPLWRQCVPDIQELVEDDLIADPLHEELLSPVPNLIHRYPDRVVVLVSGQCAVYCRFCMRKRRIGCHSSQTGSVGLDQALRYIAETPAIRDVILSGGDPLLLVDDELELLLQRLRAIPHVQIVRIGSRVPVTLPERITSRLCRMLKKFHPLYVNTHFNHPLEITPESAQACARLADVGIPLGNQTVLLKNVNDSPDVMRNLLQQLLALRVRPYYIHQMDLVKGTGHFRADVRRGIAIMEALRGHTSGMAVPHYVIDTPGGKGKVPLFPETGSFNDEMLLLKNYRGELIEYPV